MQQHNSNRRILCIGDSNTYGYDPRSFFGSRYPEGEYWASRLEGWEVINCSINGMTIPSDVSMWNSQIDSGKPALITVMLGTNDILNGCSAATSANRMQAFLEKLQCKRLPVLLIAPPPLQPGQWVESQEQLSESRMLGSSFRIIAEHQKVNYADAGEWGIELTFDGVHFTESGHRVFADELKKVLAQIIGI